MADEKSLAPASKQKRLIEFLTQQRGAIETVATKYLTAEKLLKYVGLALSRNPKLAECTPMSVLKCVITASQLGLDPSGTLGSAYLIPFKDECTLIVGYRGLIDLIRRYCDIQVEARAVFKGDVFDWSYGTNPTLVHKPGAEWVGHAPSLTHVYAVFTWPDGRKTFEVMTRKEVDRIRFSSKNGERAPWADDGGNANQGNGFIEMAKKTVVRRGVKLQPLTVEAQDAITAADETEATTLDIVADVEASEAKASQRIASKVAAQREADAAAQTPPGPDGDAETRATERAKGERVKVNNTAPAKDKPKGKTETGPVAITDDDLSALDDARPIERERDEDLGFEN